MEELKEGWRRVKLGEIADIGSSKRIFMADYRESGVPFFRGKEIIQKSKGNNITTELYITEEKYNEIKNKFEVPQKGDILLTSVGTIGVPYLVNNNEPFYFKDGNVTWIKKYRDGVYNKYIYQWIKSPLGQNQINQVTIGSTQKALTIDALKKLEINLPPLETQEKIASILSALDDKIELNNEMNKTLEEMAQTLFKRWFIDFDFPNENGEPYRSSGGKMVDSELGEIPEGWEVEELGKISTLSAGGDKPQSFSKIQTSDYTIPIYSNGVENEGLYGFTNEAKIFEKGITVSARGTIGYICLRQVPYVPIVRLVSIVPNINILSSEYLYYYLKKVEIHSTGTTQQQLTVPQFKRTKILIPNFEVLKIFTEKVESMINLLEKNKSENKNISLIRDTLLPKLMSGEVEV